jgi:hypothetical protein
VKPQRYDTMIDMNHEVHLDGSERYAMTTEESPAGI